MNNLDDDKNLAALKDYFVNPDCPFTELLSLLKLYKPSQNGSYEMAHSTKVLQIIDKHADNAIQSLLFGIQSLGHTLGVFNELNSEPPIHISNLGFLIQSITNLIEALYQLRNEIKNHYAP